MWYYWILLPLTAYLAGSIPFGVIISRRVAGIDITRKGSGNSGATNVARELGLLWGAAVLALDLLKGFIPVLISGSMLWDVQFGMPMVGLSSILGHQFSLFRKFQGGKGVATTLGALLAISPLPTLYALVIFVITVYLSDYISLGSMVSTGVIPLVQALSGGSRLQVAGSVVFWILICIKHKDNIQRLRQGEERRWRKRSVT